MKCDRCGSDLKDQPEVHRLRETVHYGVQQATYTFCCVCRESFERWVGGRTWARCRLISEPSPTREGGV